jgi:hypothetical protein
MATTEDFGARLERLEHRFAELDDVKNRPPMQSTADPLARISFASWLKLSGPTYAVMVFGFTLLWNAQQTTNVQMLELSRTTGRLEGAIERLDQSIQHLGDQVQRLSERMDRLES